MFVMNLTLQTNYQISESQKPKVAGKMYLQWRYAINLRCLMLNLSNAGVALSYTYGRVLDGAWQGESPAPVTSPSSKHLFLLVRLGIMPR